jgi:hypothetical protein
VEARAGFFDSVAALKLMSVLMASSFISDFYDWHKKRTNPIAAKADGDVKGIGAGDVNLRNYLRG